MSRTLNPRQRDWILIAETPRSSSRLSQYVLHAGAPGAVALACATALPTEEMDLEPSPERLDLGGMPVVMDKVQVPRVAVGECRRCSGHWLQQQRVGPVLYPSPRACHQDPVSLARVQGPSRQSAKQ